MAANVPAESVLINKIVKHLECSICSDRFREPKVLDCLHTFCLQCLRELRKHQKPKSTRLICPLCKRETVLEGIDVADLPGNFTLGALVEEVTMQEKLLEGQGSQIKCQNCDEKTPAISRCMDCDHFLCPECQRAHERMIVMKSHKIYTLAQLRSGEISYKSKLRENVPKCQGHPDQSLNIYCNTFQVTCTIQNHGNPKHSLSELPDALDKCNRGLRVAEGVAKVEKSKTELSTAMNERDKSEKKMNSMFAETFTDSEEKVEDSFGRLTVDQPQVPDRLSFMDSQEEVRDLFARLTMDQPEAQAKGSQSTVKRGLKKWELKTKIQDFGRGASETLISFTYVSSFSNNKIVFAHKNLLLAFSLPKIKPESPPVLTKLPIKGLTFPRCVAVNYDDQIVILDKHTVKIFNKQYQLLHQFIPCKRPKDEPRCLAVDDSNLIALGYEKEISLHNPDGSLIRTVPTPMLGRYMTISKQRFINTNYNDRSLLAIDYSGAVIFSADIHTDIKGFQGLTGWNSTPTGVCCDNDGGIYVAVDGDVLHYSPGGKLIGHSIRGCYDPYGITLTPGGDLVVVTRSSVQVYHRVTRQLETRKK